jgi:hypothetical protein
MSQENAYHQPGCLFGEFHLAKKNNKNKRMKQFYYEDS